jgi:hypothetical protein
MPKSAIEKPVTEIAVSMLMMSVFLLRLRTMTKTTNPQDSSLANSIFAASG